MGRTRSWSYGRSLACWTNWGLLGLHLLKRKEIKHVWASLYYPDCLLHTVRVLLTNTSWAVSSWSLHSKFFSLILRQNLDEAHLPVLGGSFFTPCAHLWLFSSTVTCTTWCMHTYPVMLTLPLQSALPFLTLPHQFPSQALPQPSSAAHLLSKLSLLEILSSILLI